MPQVELVLPPRGTMFYYALRTSLALLAGYMGVWITIGAGRAEIDVPGDAKLADAVKKMVKDLMEGRYGVEPGVAVDAARLRGLASFLSKRVGREVDSKSCGSILEAYASYAEDLASKGMLVRELMSAMKVFDKGYPEDGKLCDVAMLSRLSPEYMESIRILGGVGFKSVPKKYAFSQMRIGPHTACLGLAGLWASLTYIDFERGLEYYLFPDVVGKIGASIAAKLPESLKKVLSQVKGRPPTSTLALALVVALSTAGLPGQVRSFDLAVVFTTGRRVDLLESGLPLGASRLMRFADALLGISAGTLERLLRLLLNALRRPGAGQDLGDAAARIAHAIFEALEGLISPEEVGYIVARHTYAQSSEERERLAGLRPHDVRAIVEAVRSAVQVTV